jgi:Spherulation-specific family 4/PEP-CTERM motif
MAPKVRVLAFDWPAAAAGRGYAVRMKKTTHTLLAALAAMLATTAPVQATELLVPAYFYPSSNPALSYWDEMTAAAAAGAKITAIVNPNNGPGAAFNSDYSTAINAFRAAGGTVLGYVYTCYGNNNCVTGLPSTRSVQDVLSDAAKYRSWYGVSGVFLDEMSNDVTDYAFYKDVANGLRSTDASTKIFGNPGTATDEIYLNVADTLVTFERGTGSYAGASTRQPWMDTEPASRQAHLHYNVDTEAQMRSLLTQAQALNAGYVYITNDCYDNVRPACTNPWNSLPSYWNAEVAAVTAVPEPPTAWLALVGAGVLAWRVRRKAA